jgi:hypothetical protein
MWDHAGHAEKARLHYQRALHHLPEHAHAVSHLAGYLSANEAEGLYERLLKTSDDPEHRAALGMLKNRRRAGSGDVLVAEAKAHYLKLMKTLPLAFADHAGWFWLGPGADPIRALEVASLNLDARRTPEAFTLKIASLLAVGDKDAACETAEDAVILEPKTAGLLARCADAFDACGRSLRAEEIRPTPSR